MKVYRDKLILPWANTRTATECSDWLPDIVVFKLSLLFWYSSSFWSYDKLDIYLLRILHQMYHDSSTHKINHSTIDPCISLCYTLLWRLVLDSWPWNWLQHFVAAVLFLSIYVWIQCLQRNGFRFFLASCTLCCSRRQRENHKLWIESSRLTFRENFTVNNEWTASWMLTRRLRIHLVTETLKRKNSNVSYSLKLYLQKDQNFRFSPH